MYDVPPESAGVAVQSSFQTLKEQERAEIELPVEHADGHLIDVGIDAVAIGENRFVAYVRDDSSPTSVISRLASDASAAWRLKERFELAVEGANLGVWDWDMETNTAAYNEQFAAQLGYSLSEIDTTYDGWESRPSRGQDSRDRSPRGPHRRESAVLRG